MRSTTAALLLVVAALAAWWKWPRAEMAPTPSEPRAAGDSATPSEPKRTAQEAAVSREPVPSVAAAAPIEGPVEVRVIDWRSRAPVAGADVWWTCRDTWDKVRALAAFERARYQADAELRVRTFGGHARTDAAGLVRVHLDLEFTDVVARRDDHPDRRAGWTRISLPHAQSGVTLEVSRELAVAARVVDPLGSPVAGVPVELRIRSGSSRRETDAAGRLRFDYRESWIGRDVRGIPAADEAKLVVPVPGLQACAVTFAACSPPTEPVTLVLPPTGEVHVHLAHPGRPIESLAARLWIGAADDRQARNDGWHKDAEAEDVVRFRTVPLLVPVFSVEVEIGDLVLQRTVAGPAAAGQIVPAIFEVPEGAVALVGRVLDARGKPVASQQLPLRCNLPRRDHRMWLATDEHGRFLWHPGAPRPGETERELTDFVVQLQLGALDAIHGRVARRKLLPGINDLGDIRLDYLPILVSGRFRFAGGAPGYVPIALERWIGGDREGSAAAWQRQDDFFLYQHDGRFVLRGTLPPGRLRLTFGNRAEPVELARDKEDLVVPIVR